MDCNPAESKRSFPPADFGRIPSFEKISGPGADNFCLAVWLKKRRGAKQHKGCDALCRDSSPSSLPDFADLLADHGVTLFAADGFGELRHVRLWSIPAETRQRMWIGVGHQALVLQPIVRAPNLRPAKKEALLGSEAILVRGTRLAFQ